MNVMSVINLESVLNWTLKRGWLCALAIQLPIGVANAADLPMKAPAVPAPAAYSWTGCYVGFNAGGASAGTDFTSTARGGTYLVDPADVAAVSAAGSGSANNSGFIGGAQAGCNLQTGTLVWGLEADWDYFSTTAQFTSAGALPVNGANFSVTNSLKTDWLATIRHRVGIVASSSLLYVTGGVAFADLKFTQAYSDTTPAAASISASSTQTGWVAGAGFETHWIGNWTFRVEYLFAKFPSLGASGLINAAGIGTNPLQSNADLTVQTARVALNFKL